MRAGNKLLLPVTTVSTVGDPVSGDVGAPKRVTAIWAGIALHCTVSGD